MKNKVYGIWVPKVIKGKKLQEFVNWLNTWGNRDINSFCRINNKLNDYGRGYEKAIEDVFDKLGFKYKLFDKRTKTGFKK